MGTELQLGEKPRFWGWKEVRLHNAANVLHAHNCPLQNDPRGQLQVAHDLTPLFKWP